MGDKLEIRPAGLLGRLREDGIGSIEGATWYVAEKLAMVWSTISRAGHWRG
jgi:hypothetical protein